MFRKLFIALVVMVVACAAVGQTPENIRIRKGSWSNSSQKVTCTSDAGTISLGLHTGQSNAVTADTIFLCFNDQIEILHNRDSDLSGDPNPATAPGIVYAYYDCPPTLGFDGPTLANITMDPCLNRTSPILVNGNPAEQTDSLWVTRESQGMNGNINGDITFINDGRQQASFTGGDPVQFFFAPITVDDWENLTFEVDTNNVQGGCINVNASEAFSVVFLNEISERDVNTNIGDNGCRGSFVVEGGLSEFDNNTRYSVNITLASNPEVTGTLLRSSRPSHGDTVEFFIPRPGLYNITVEDGVSCGAQFNVNMAGCEAVTFNADPINILPGDTTCVAITVEDFTDILTMEGTLEWDSTVVHPVEVRNLNPNLLGFSDALINVDTNFMRWLWFEQTGTNGVDLPDGAILFEICFEGVGEFGETSPISFVGDGFELFRASNNEQLGYILDDGGVALSDDNLFVEYEIDSVDCFGDQNGSFRVTVAGGTAPYFIDYAQLDVANPQTGSVSINQESGDVNVMGLSAGEYQINIEDATADIRIDTILIPSPPSAGINLIPTLPSCAGESTGSIRAQLIVGGQIISNPGEEYSFRWSTGATGINSLDSIASGFFAVTVTDEQGCEVSASATLADPPTLEADIVVTNASCPGVVDGSILVNPNGGTAPYTFNWQAGLDAFNGTFASSNPAPLQSGIYQLTITDNNGCSIERSVTVGNRKTLRLEPVITQVSCNGFNDGTIFVTANSTDPEPPFNFSWANAGALPTPPDNSNNTSELRDLSPGTYVVTLTDVGAAGCATIDSFVVTEPEPLEISILNQTVESCEPGSDAEVIVGVTGGTFPYAYDWSNTDMDSIASNLSANIYELVVRDDNNCESNLEITIGQVPPPTITNLANDTLTCPGDVDGTLTVEATPSNAPVTSIIWSNGSTGNTITDLPAGNYGVTITDDDGCIAIDTATVVAPEPIVIDEIIPMSPTCPGDSDGSLTVNASGGTQPYRYVWEGNGINDTVEFNLLPSLSAGTYNLTVVDANNCASATDSPILPEAPSIQLAFNEIDSVSCRDQNEDGAATAVANYSDFSDGNFTFRWETGEVTENNTESRAVRLAAGFQQVTVTDDDGCFLIDSLLVPAPPRLEVNGIPSPVTCNGFDDGVAEVAIDGGTAPYRINWVETGESTERIENLTSGTYNAIILDANDCQTSQQVEVTEPEALTLIVDTDQTQNITCAGDMNGVLAVIVNDAAGINPLLPAPYTWSDNIAAADTNVAAGLAPGTYSVTITDVQGCEDSLSFELTSPDPIMAVIPDPVPPRCFGDLTQIVIESITGGNGTAFLDYTYNIDNQGFDFAPNQPADVAAGTRVITIEDPLGCTVEEIIEIEEPDQIQVAFSPDEIEIELGDTSQRLMPIISSSLPIDSFIWTPAEFLSQPDIRQPTVIALDDVDLTLRIVDENGCDATANIFVEVDKNRNVFIPNIFTPDGNGSGLNEEFRIFACSGVANINFVRLYDRWGNMIVDRNNILPSCEGGIPVWDGRFNGDVMNAGVYVYLVEVEFVDGVTLLYRGDVALVR